MKPGEHFIKIIHDEMVSLFGEKSSGISFQGKYSVILLAGLQGVGKTTTAGKIANHLKSLGKTVLLVAADVYRPAAVEQLKKIGKQINVKVFSENDIDPVKISKNAVSYAKKIKTDVVIIDTAGRLHFDEHMMLEIQRIKKIQ